MAETKGNGRAGEDQQPLKVSARGQFIRDLSFENFAAQRKEWAPVELSHELKLLLDLAAQEDSHYLVSVKVILEASGGGQPVYMLEIDYCGLFQIENLPESQLQPYLAVQCPQLMFPFLRRIVADLTRDGGFPSYQMEIINFAAIYQNELMRQRAAGGSKSRA